MLTTKPYYIETQKFNQWWLWLLLIAITCPTFLLFARGFYLQILMGEPWGGNPMSDNGLVVMLIVTFAIMAGILWLFISAQLRIEVRDRAVYYTFPPVLNRMVRIGQEEIEGWEVRTYSPMWEYGGLGWRVGFGKKGYLVRGNKGLELILRGNKKVMLGTQHPEELEAALNKELRRDEED